MAFLSEIPIEIWIAGVLALYMAWAIGANDVANAMGTPAGYALARRFAGACACADEACNRSV